MPKTKKDTVESINSLKEDTVSYFRNKYENYDLEDIKNQIKSVSKIKLFFFILCGFLALNPEWRWECVLAIYLPLLSNVWGLRLSFLAPLFINYARFETWLNPSLFEAQPLPEIFVNDLEEKDLWNKVYAATDGFSKPAVLRGDQAHSIAVQTWGYPEWIEKYSEFQLYEMEKKTKTNDDNHGHYQLKRGNFSDFMKDIQDGKFRYSYGLDELYVKYPELPSDFNWDIWGKTLNNVPGGDSDFCRVNAVFISGTGRGFVWHNAHATVIGTQIRGAKDWEFIDPKYSLFLGPETKDNTFATGFHGTFPKDLFEKMPRYKTRINAGDSILLPPWYWHDVSSEATDETGLVMFNTCRFTTIYESVRNAPMLEMFFPMGSKNWIHKYLPGSARFIPFMRAMQDGFREYFGIMPQWTDLNDCFSSKAGACKRYFDSRGWEIKDSTF